MAKREPTELQRYIAENYQIQNKNKLAFIIEFIKTGKMKDSYLKFHPNVTDASARAMASKFLRDINFTVSDFLDVAGHDVESITEALDRLKATDPDKYLNHVEKLRKLDVQKVEHSGTITLPGLNITTTADDE